MALRVWLPLNGTLENKGASDDITYAMSSGNSFTSGGKISNNALKLTKVQQILGTTSCMTGVKEVSYAFWVKVNTAWSTNWLDGIKWISTDGTSTATERQEFYTNCTLVGTWYKGGAISGKEFMPGVWTHLAATINYNTGEACFYVNGDLKGTTSNVDTTYYCRGDFYIGDNGVDILQNDVRIYDHCLSIKEVKEIAQGLILHYKLDGWSGGIGENLVWNSNWNKNSTSPPESWTNWGSPPTREIVQINNKYWLHVISNTTQFQGYSQNWTKRVGFGEISAGEILTVSFTAYLASAASIAPIGIHWCNTSSTIVSQVWTTTSLTATPTRYSFTYTTPADCVGFNIMVGDNTNTAHEIWITDIKVERGSVATPWSPAPEDLGIDTTKITDSSGYEHDGNIVNATTENINLDCRYQVCTNFLGTTVDTTSNTITGAQYLYTSLPMPAWSALTLAWWGNNIAYGRGGIFETTGTTGNIWEGSDYNTTAIANWDSTFGIYNGSNRVNIFSNFVKDSSWHYHTITFDGANVKYYCDGTLKQTSALTGTLPAITGFKIGLGRAGGVYRQIKQKVSDLRIYATAFSSEDILDLYHTSANVDDLGNFHGFEFVEDNENKISKNGIINNNIFSSSIINNFTQTRSTQGWTLGGNLDTNGHAILVGTAPTISSDTFYVDNDDIYEINFNINMTSPSSSGDGLHLGITSSTNTIRCVYNWSSGTYTETDNASSSWNTYFVGGFKLTRDIHIKTYVVGANVNINTIKPEATDNAVTVSVIKIKSPMSVGFRAGYNTNTTMTLEFWDPSVIKINDHIKASIKSIETVANDFIEK